MITSRVTTTSHVVRPSIGHLTVAAACGFAGLAVSRGQFLPGSLDFFKMVSFLLLIAPFFVSRNSVYEYRDVEIFSGKGVDSEPWLKALSKQLPAFVLLLGAIQISSSLWVLHEITQFNHVDLIIRLACTAAPFYLYLFWLIPRWPDHPKVFWFRYRTLIPAILTCTMPFLYGWALDKSLLIILVPATIITALWLLSFLDGDKPWILGIVGGGIFVLLFFSQFILSREGGLRKTIEVYTLGSIMTLLMGVCESWRVTMRAALGLERIPNGETGATVHRRHRRGINLVASILPPFAIATMLHPATGTWYLPSVLIIVILQYGLWFWVRREDAGFWNFAGLAVGYAVPVAIVIGTVLQPASRQTMDVVSHEPNWTVIVGIWGVLVALLFGTWALSVGLKDRDLSDTRSRELFLLITGTTSSLLGIAIVVISLFTGWPSEVVLSDRLYVLLATYGGIATLCTLCVLVKRMIKS